MSTMKDKSFKLEDLKLAQNRLKVFAKSFPNLTKAVSDVETAFIRKGGGLKGALSTIGASFKGLGRIIKAHPFATLAVGIGIASAALKAYREQQEKYQESLRETISTADENIQKYTEEKDVLLALQDKLDSAKNDKEKLLSIQSELNKAIGETPGLVQNEGNAYDKASAKIQARIKELDELVIEETQSKINAQKEIFRTNTTPYELGVDNLAEVGLNIDIQDAADELNRLKAERQEIIDLGAKEDSIGITDYDKKIARYIQILQGKVKEAQEIFADYIDIEFDDDISKSYANKYIETLIFGGEDNLDNIQAKIDEMKPKIEEFNGLKDELLDFQVEGKSTDEIALEIQRLINEVKKSSPEVAELMQISLNSLVPNEETIGAGIDKIKEAFKKSFGTEELEFNTWIDTLSEEDKEIVYKISCDTNTASWNLDNWQKQLDEYKNHSEKVNKITLKTDIQSLWDSEDFEDTKKELISLVEEFNEISPNKIIEVSSECEELADILNEDGMSAEFLAVILGQMAVGNNGLELITEDALKLNEALNGMEDVFDDVITAKNKYDEAMSVDEKDTNFKSLAEAYEVLNQQFVEGKTNSNAFWAASEFIFGSDKLKEFGYDIDLIYKAMSQNANIFKDSDSAGFGFLDKLYQLSESGKVLDKAGNVIAEISKLSDGFYDIDIDYENIDEIADKMNLSEESVLACLEAISMFGDISFYDIEEVSKVIEEIGIATEFSGKKIVDIEGLTEELINLGKTDKEINDVIEGLTELGYISISPSMDIDTVVENLKTLGIAIEDTSGIEIDYTSLTNLLNELGFTREEAGSLVSQLAEIDKVDVETALSYIDNVDFSSAEGEVGSVTSAVQDLTDALNGIDGKTISVVIDYKASLENKAQTILGLLGVPGYAKGTKGAAGGYSLVGEEGEELVQSGDEAYFVGTNGAEIVNLQPGDTVYTASETKKIKKSRNRFTGTIPAFKGGIKGTVNNKKYSSVDGSSKNSANSNKDEPDKPEKYDWIEVSLDRAEKAMDKLETTSESTFETLDTKLKATDDLIKATTSQIKLQEKAYKRYMKEADSVKISDSLKKKVQDGSIDINEYDDETKELIDEYSQWYNKALECSDAIQELDDSLSSLYEKEFDDISTDFENQLSQIEHLTNTYENGLSDLEARGYLGGQEYYTALQQSEQQRIALLEKELADLTTAMETAIDKGEIEEGSESWYAMQESINGVKEEIQASNTALIEYQNSIDELDWEAFDFMQERISAITNEAEFLIKLLDDSDLFDDKGRITGTGLATAGLHAVSYNTYMKQSEEYAKKILEVNAKLANDPSNTKLIEQREELLELQRESILAAESEKDAIIDMIEEGINKQLDSMKELIDAYKESLQSAKDLYEYQKKIKDHSSNIAALQKQLAAYENDTSEETRAKIQQIRVDLEKAQEELEETEYDKYISDTEKMLDNFYEDYEDTLNARMDNIDTLISTMIDTINLNAFDISSTIQSACSDVGYTITDTMKSIWSGSGNVVSEYGDSSFSSSSTSNTVDGVMSGLASLLSKGSEIANDILNPSTSDNSVSDKTEDKKPTTETPAKNESTKKEDTAKKITVGGKINAGSAKIYTNSSGKGATNQYYSKDPIYVVLGEENGYLKVRHHKLSSGVSGWFKKSDVKTYKTGGLVDYTGIAQLDGTPSKPELVLNSKDTENFIQLKDALRQMAEDNVQLFPSSNYINGFSSVVPHGILDMSSYIYKYREPQENSYSVSVGDINTTIEIDHVMDYDDFVSQIKRDPQFERFIGSITLDRLVGGSKLSKYKYWK